MDIQKSIYGYQKTGIGIPLRRIIDVQNILYFWISIFLYMDTDI